MGRYLRWSTCHHCGQKITQTSTHGNWHPAFSHRTARSIRCETSPTWQHEPRVTEQGENRKEQDR